MHSASHFFPPVGLPGGSVVKNPLASVGDVGLIPGLGRSPGEGNSKSLQYSYLGNRMDRGAWGALQGWGENCISRTESLKSSVTMFK